MRLRSTAILVATLMLTGCGKSDESPTPAQAAQLDILRQASITQLQVMLKRPLSDDEQQCVVVKLENGKLNSRIVAPLSDTVKEWHRNNSSTQP
jgi:hypothetical protein